MELLADITIRDIGDFEERMKKQFEKQLREYVCSIQEVWNYEKSPQLQTHATMTAYAFGGMPIAKIAREWDPVIVAVLKNPRLSLLKPFEDPDSATRKAIKRFSDLIGLTMPRKREATLAKSLVSKDKK